MPVHRVIRVVATVLAVAVVIGTGVAWNNVRGFEDGIFHMTASSLGKGGDDGAIDILLVGLDSRTDAHGNPLSQEELATLRAGDEEATNTDTIILVRIPNNGKSATAISIPRDSYVQAPGLGKTKINGVYGQTREAKRATLVRAGASATEAEAAGTEAGREALIKTVADLKGKKVALNKGSNVHYLLVRALEQAGLGWRDIRPVYLAPADARAAFQSGNVDAWVIWDPYLAAAQKQLDTRTLKNGGGLVDNYIFYLARRPWIIANPGIGKIVLEELHAVGEWTNKNPEAAAKELAPIIGLPQDTTLLAVKRERYGLEPITPATVAAQQKIADTFYSLKLIPKSLDIRSATLPSGK